MKYYVGDISEQFLQFGDVRNLMRYFNFEEIEWTYRRLAKKELAKSSKKFKQIKHSAKRNDLQIATKALRSRTKRTNEMYHKLGNLYQEIHAHQYKPAPSTSLQIPKDNGEFRTIKMPTFRDKIVQDIMTRILMEIYDENILCDASYAYRRGKGCHDALRALNIAFKDKNTKYVIKADIEKFFDNINRSKLLEMLEGIIKDKYFLMYIRRFLEAGALQQGKITYDDKGTNQGNLISPVLGNIYLHYALDKWFEDSLKSLLKRCRANKIL